MTLQPAAAATGHTIVLEPVTAQQQEHIKYQSSWFDSFA